MKIIVLGAGFFLAGSIKRLEKAGFHVIALDRDPAAPGFQYASESYPIDICDHMAVTHIAKEKRVDGILPLNDFAVPTAAHVVAKLNLAGISKETAVLVTDKCSMRECWADNKLAQPEFRTASTEQGAMVACSQIGFPCIIKPDYSGGGGRGVIIIENEHQLTQSFEQALPFAMNGKILIEQYIEGTELTIETLSENGEVHILAMSDKIKPPIRSRVATDLFYPANLDEKILEKCRELTVKAVKALNIDIGAAHTEIIVSDSGQPQLVESAARGGGGHITSHIVEWCSGVPFVVEWANLCCKQPASLFPTCSNSAVYHFFCPSQGTLMEIKGLSEASEFPGVAKIGALKDVGSQINDLQNSTERTGYLVLQCDNRKDSENLLKKVTNTVKYIVKPETELEKDYAN